MAALQYVDIPGYDALLLRDTYKNLIKPEALMTRSHEWLSNTDAHWGGDDKTWRFPSGATLGFGYLDGPMDHFNYQSAAYQFVGIDETVAIRHKQALYLFSRLRKLLNKDGTANSIPIRFRCASNPPTAEQLARGKWVKDRYVDPKTKKKDSVFIKSKLKDNPYLDADDYVKSLNELDSITRKQLLEGDWEIHASGRVFNIEDIVFVDAPLPRSVLTLRYWDLAATEPTKEGHEPCWTSGAKLSRTEEGFFVLENVKRFRRNPGELERIIRHTADIDGYDVQIRMEQEPGSAGKIVIANFMKNVLAGYAFRGDKVTGSKWNRSLPLASQIDAGNFYMVKGQWNEAFLEELDLWPDGPFKDQVDSAAGGLRELTLSRQFNLTSV